MTKGGQISLARAYANASQSVVGNLLTRGNEKRIGTFVELVSRHKIVTKALREQARKLAFQS